MSNVEQITPGFWRVCLKQPIPSDVYCYLIIKDQVTMIDCGHPSIVSQQALMNGLHEIGIDQLVLTHRHVDHIGALVCDEASLDAFTMAAPDQIKEVTRLERTSSIKNKLPKEISEQLLNVEMIEAEKSYYAMPNSFQVHRELHEGDKIDIGGEMLQVINTPGHSFDHISLLHEPSGILVGGDLLIKNGPPAIADLNQYISSLDILRTLSLSSVLPGHGPVITNHDEVIGQSIQRIIETDNRIIEMLKSGPKSYYEIALGFTGGKIHKGILFFMDIVETHVKRMLKNSQVAIQEEKLILV